MSKTSSKPSLCKYAYPSGTLVKFNMSNRLMKKAFGFRTFEATIDSEVFVGEMLGKRICPTGNFGMTVGNPSFYKKHGAGTWYYKVLIENKLYWIAKEHLEKIERKRP